MATTGISYYKCNLMYVGRTRCNANLFLNVSMLPVFDRGKYGPLCMDSHLTFTHHIDEIIAREWCLLIDSLNVLCRMTLHLQLAPSLFMVDHYLNMNRLSGHFTTLAKLLRQKKCTGEIY